MKNKQFKCEICCKRFSKESELSKHISRIHDGKKKLKCFTCNTDYDSRNDMEAHINSVHDGKKPYKCPNCDHECLLKKDLKRHIQAIHTFFECDMCSRMYPKSNQLKVHKEKAHERKKLFKCDACNESFIYKGHLKKHNETVHEEMVKFNCNDCAKEFLSFESFEIHKKIEHELINESIDETNIDEFDEDLRVKLFELDKKYVCKICEKEVFYGKDAHIKKYHTYNDGLKCPKCGKSFSNYKRVLIHVVTEHESRTPCSICGKTFPRKWMKRHIQSKHAGIFFFIHTYKVIHILFSKPK